MSKKASTTLIGAFVVGGIVLAVILVILFGGREYFRTKNYVVMYFEGSVNGLNIGSAVMFRGVKVGTVTDIRMVLNTDSLDVQIPVTAEIDPKSLSRDGSENGALVIPASTLVSHGLRAQLKTQSLLTGQLYIELDFQSDKEARFIGTDAQLVEIPTIPTPIQELGKKFDELNVEKVIGNVTSAMNGLSALVNSPELHATFETLNKTLFEYSELAKTLNAQIGPVAQEARNTLGESRETLTALRGVIEQSNKVVVQMDATMRKWGNTADVAAATANDAQRLVAPESRLVFDVSRALEEFTNAARALRILAEALERHPEALLRGKPTPEEPR